MKIIIGDMSFEDDVRLSAGSRTAEDWQQDQNRAERILRENMDRFLKTAELCYIKRYDTIPARTTKDEF